MTKEEKIRLWRKMLKSVRGKDFGKTKDADGLCIILDHEDYPYQFQNYFHRVLPKTKRGIFCNYCWEPGAKAPRIKWINEQIKILEKK